ncbi:LOW QUALITY PROTEIN: monocarboxylate transporter 13-like [Microcaecilia unicolor]|uniref:Monocarboxylate transporter 13 n=1 Tax=Microcaecilia unicolor TaxID=1415580 RepID=A0A6P7WT20_9AMPH|nr:LOW QUALITY PROTEIN: monocarboxylate transporter 13-like [Microcaecilia unicolor]
MPGPRAYQEPPDGGWGWMIVLGSFVQTALIFGLIRSFGAFFVEFVRYFDELAARVSWVTSIGIAVQQCLSPLASALSTRYGARPVIMTGGLVAGLGLFLASFATSLVHLYICIGLLSGFGWALVVTPVMASVTRYFKKKRTIATALSTTGVVLSSAFSPLFQYLIDSYSWRGALIILAGMTLNLMVCGALIRPLTLKEDLPTSGEEVAKQNQHKTRLRQCSSLFGLSLLSHWPFMKYVLANTLISVGYFVPFIHLVAHAQCAGFDEYQAAFVISVAAGADLCGRIFTGWLADWAHIRLLHMFAVWSSVTGFAMILVPLGSSYAALLGICILYGFFAAGMIPLIFSVLPEIVGIGNVFRAIGILQMIESFGSLLGIPLSGWLRDLTGDYTISFWVAGAFLLLGTLVLCTLPNFFSCCSPKPVNQLEMIPEVLKLDPASELFDQEKTVNWDQETNDPNTASGQGNRSCKECPATS